MKPLAKGLLLAAIQLTMVAGIGGKLLYERATRPRVWVLCQTYDPNLPIRGRYLSEQLRLPAEGFPTRAENNNYMNYYANRVWAFFEVRNGELVAAQQGSGSAGWVHLTKRGDAVEASVEEPVLMFIPDTANGPIVHRGEELWVEVTVPRAGPPRPIRMGIKKDGVLTPLKLD